jgi:hydrogenase large subunit
LATKTVTLDPVSRIEGHLRIDLDIKDNVVGAARSSGTSFRGFEPILVGRDPRDAPHITQRICGVCPVPHARASTAAFEAAAQLPINNQARLIRNLIEAANFIDSHLLHFYVLALPDYVAGIPTAAAGSSGGSPKVWEGRGGLDVAALVNHLVLSMQVRRDCNSIGALLGGKIPHQVGIVTGGATASITGDVKSTLMTLVTNIVEFLTNTYRSDVESLVYAFPEYLDIGASGAGFLSFGGYPEADGSLLFAQGLVRTGTTKAEPLEPAQITESVAYARYEADSPRNPASGATVPSPKRQNVYSWTKAPRMNGAVCEVGPLARSVVAGLSFAERGVHARHLARVAEANRLATRLSAWVAALEVGVSACPVFPKPPSSGHGMGLVEAPRGSLGHWLSIDAGVISHYQVISPTTWNGSPRDDAKQPGALEKALEGVAVADPEDPIEVMRVIHSFDPCLQCSVH